MRELRDLPIERAAREMAEGSLDGKLYRQSFLEAIDRLDEQIGAFVSVSRDLDPVSTGPLCGIPIAVKDNIATRDFPTTCASRMLEQWQPTADATVVRRLREAGCVVVGKTNLDEFAMGSSTEHSLYGATRNPWNRDRVAGGSSGGSAAAVAAGMVPVALGSDTGGSVRQPAAYCGVLGLKPTWGRVSRSGLVAFASSLDQIGIFARRTADLAAVYRIAAGPDRADPTTRSEPLEEADRKEGVDGLRIGLLFERDEESREVVSKVASLLRQGGATTASVDVPSFRHAVAVYQIVANAEASSNLARYDGIRYGRRAGGTFGSPHELMARSRREGFGEEVRRRILLGTFVLSAGYHDAFYGRAQQLRRMMRRELAPVWDACDLIMMPATPGPAFRLGELKDDPIRMYRTDVYTAPANLTGAPAMSIPAGLSDESLPLSVQVVGPPLGEERLLRVSRFLESEIGWPGWRPPLW